VPLLKNLSLIPPPRLCNPHDLGVAFQVAEDLLAERVGDLRVDPGVGDLAIAEVVGRALGPGRAVPESPA